MSFDLRGGARKSKLLRRFATQALKYAEGAGSFSKIGPLPILLKSLFSASSAPPR
jgi:hypothetical protein